MTLTISLTDDKLSVLGEIVFGNLEVEGSRALAYTSGDVVVGSVAGAEPASKVAGLANGHTTQVRADTYYSSLVSRTSLCLLAS